MAPKSNACHGPFFHFAPTVISKEEEWERSFSKRLYVPVGTRDSGKTYRANIRRGGSQRAYTITLTSRILNEWGYPPSWRTNGSDPFPLSTVTAGKELCAKIKEAIEYDRFEEGPAGVHTKNPTFPDKTTISRSKGSILWSAFSTGRRSWSHYEKLLKKKEMKGKHNSLPIGTAPLASSFVFVAEILIPFG